MVFRSNEFRGAQNSKMVPHFSLHQPSFKLHSPNRCTKLCAEVWTLKRPWSPKPYQGFFKVMMKNQGYSIHNGNQIRFYGSQPFLKLVRMNEYGTINHDDTWADQNIIFLSCSCIPMVQNSTFQHSRIFLLSD